MFAYMKKSDSQTMLPILYDIMYENMSAIVPKVMPKNEFISAVTSGLMAENRQILLFYESEEIVGFLQYFISKDNTTFCIEELQIMPAYQMSGVFVKLMHFMKNVLPKDLKYIEAFAHVENTNSIRIQSRIGLSEIGREDGIIHMRGKFSALNDRYFNKIQRGLSSCFL
ncbi:MAG: hypothetical protein IJ002_06125 [Clostridia bacterium]|nr:hypothetical protein [Clostridia bacterium]